MKFGQVFKQSLKEEGFPPEWVESAISYSQLKKCIKRLTSELQEIGLDPVTLTKLLKHVEDYNAASAEQDDQDRPFAYILDQEPGQDAGPLVRNHFQPRLLFYVDEATGEVQSAQLHQETKRKLQLLAIETGMSTVRVDDEPASSPPSTGSAGKRHSLHSIRSHQPGFRKVTVPITSDVEFFDRLTSEVSGIEQLQQQEERRLNHEIANLGKVIAKSTNPDKKANRKMLLVWRQIFQMYIEEGIFFGNTERDHKPHNSQKAVQGLNAFSDKIAKAGLMHQMKRKDSAQALNMFLNINRDLLRGLRFGEINYSAMLKILKKFDKRTALGVKSSFPRTIRYPEFSEHLAKSVCAEVNTQVLSHIPQLDDYSCPMCCDIKWRPVKLNCGHVFCIRCLIVMQTNKQHNCPFCREKTVLNANSDNLDQEMASFLKKWFPDEVKAKQKHNETMAGVDQYGEVYAHPKCAVM